MKIFKLCSVFILIPFLVQAQGKATGGTANLVSNPGFEEYAIPPIGWFYKGVYFSKVMKYWTSPTGASPDAYGPTTRVPAHWATQGFGQQAAHSGKSMAGLTLYGCSGGKPHCREYLQTLLNEPLIDGQAYELSFWVCPLPRGLRIDRIGAAFTSRELRQDHDTLLAIPPTLAAADIVDRDDEEWIKLSWTFTPASAGDYLIIGNFFADGDTRTLAGEGAPLPFAYYYIDDVQLTKLSPLVPLPARESELARSSYTKGMIVPLKNIYFDFDRDELLPRSFIELNQLYGVLEDQPGLEIRINGHTDSVGNADYNLDLSERRARAVVQYLEEKGIAPGRLQYKGFGATTPIADNHTDEGRQMNRRVEFEILQPP